MENAPGNQKRSFSLPGLIPLATWSPFEMRQAITASDGPKTRIGNLKFGGQMMPPGQTPHWPCLWAFPFLSATCPWILLMSLAWLDGDMCVCIDSSECAASSIPAIKRARVISIGTNGAGVPWAPPIILFWGNRPLNILSPTHFPAPSLLARSSPAEVHILL